MDWIGFFSQFGYLGVFAISTIGALSVVFPIPYTLIYYILGATLDPLFIAIAGGLGSALGEVSGYYLGYFGHRFINDNQKRRMFYLMKIIDRFGPIVVFLFALTPLPDDMLFIPLGILRYSFLKALVPCLIGKFAMAFIIAYSGKVSFEFIRLIFGGSDWVVTILMLILLAIIIVFMFRIDWEDIFRKYIEK